GTGAMYEKEGGASFAGMASSLVAEARRQRQSLASEELPHVHHLRLRGHLELEGAPAGAGIVAEGAHLVAHAVSGRVLRLEAAHGLAVGGEEQHEAVERLAHAGGIEGDAQDVALARGVRRAGLQEAQEDAARVPG